MKNKYFLLYGLDFISSVNFKKDEGGNLTKKSRMRCGAYLKSRFRAKPIGTRKSRPCHPEFIFCLRSLATLATADGQDLVFHENILDSKTSSE